MDARKVSDTSIEITKQAPQPEPTKIVYERSFIDSQILAVLAQKQSYDDARDAELTELYGIRDEMDKAGIVSKPVEILPDPATTAGNIGG
jgi:hypothetical protein